MTGSNSATRAIPYNGLQKTGSCSSTNGGATGCCFKPCLNGYCGSWFDCGDSGDYVPTSDVSGIHANPPTANSGDEADDTDKCFGYAKELSDATIIYGRNDQAGTTVTATSAECGEATTANTYKWKIVGEDAYFTFTGTLETAAGAQYAGTLASPALGALAAFAGDQYPKCMVKPGYYPTIG